MTNSHRLAWVLLLPLLCAACTKPKAATLRVWQTESDPGAQKALGEIAAEFEVTHPGVTVQLEGIAWGALSQKLTVALSTGDVPDIAHLQPFMAASLHQKGLLMPIDDVIGELNAADIYPAVRDLQFFDGHYYGIAYAVGTTYFAYRKDWAAARGLPVPDTWRDYLAFVKALTEDSDHDGKIDRYGVILPGGSPFFMDQFTVELVASNGGRLFDPNGRPTLTEKPVLETLEFWRELVKYAPPDWTSEDYAAQFRSFAAGRGATVPVTYARAARQIEKDAPQIADPEYFAVMTQPLGPSGKTSYSTIDCEPWVILSGSKNADLAKEFLKAYYKKDNYLKVVSQVPIQLTPIIRSLAEGSDYLDLPFVKKWKPWHAEALQMMREGRTRPIFLAEEDDRVLPFLMEVQGSRVLTDMVLAVAVEGQAPEQAASEAQKKAEELITRLGFRKW